MRPLKQVFRLTRFGADPQECRQLLQCMSYSKLEKVSLTLEPNYDTVPGFYARYIEYDLFPLYMPYSIRDMTLRNVYFPFPETVQLDRWPFLRSLELTQCEVSLSLLSVP